MTPYEQADDLDFIIIGNLYPSPGLVTLSGHDRVKNWDVQAAKGTTGASTTLNGDPIGRFKASFYLAHDRFDEFGAEIDDFAIWDEFQRMLEGLIAGPTPQAVPIYHPDLARNHFTEVTIASIGGMVHDGRGGATVTVEFIEYRPPKPKAAAGAKAKPAPAGGKSGAGKASKPDPNAAAKAELQALVTLASIP